ncbi:MAG TPA: bifunctional oligoribonuclease/PAP phosphatase NrnA [Thermodesulfobacteriota bacterium]|nr:bifunctional oligoribonuclease/PAP phosphatase NrnA [Thermodesulfobacteriota bacterium]
MATEEKIEKLKTVVENKRVLILTHNNPDPDAISAAWGLHYLLRKKFNTPSLCAYGGLIARAENRAMVRVLNIPIYPLDAVNPRDFDLFALVDTQPGTGNNSLPRNLKAAVVLDHHSARKPSRSSDFVDIRLRYGSSATIITEYLRKAGLPIPKRMATALYLGIKTDTQNLGRHATEADYNAAIYLYPQVQLKLLSEIEYPDLPRDYFIDFDRGLHESELFGKTVFCDLGALTNSDMVALMADFLLRFSGISWSFVMGTDDSRLIFSLRTKRLKENAGRVARLMVKGIGTAGGHNRTGGGQIPLKGVTTEKERKTREAIQKRFLKLTGQENAKPERLLPSSLFLPMRPEMVT